MTDLSDLTSPVADEPAPMVLTQESLGGLPVRKIVDVEQTFNMMIYGQSGVGKTVLAGSSCEVEGMGPVLFIDVEGGTLSMKRRYPQIEVVRVASWSDMIKVYSELYEGKHGFQTVVIDSLTEVQKFSMLNIMKEVIREDPNRDPEVPSIRDWGKNGEQTRRFIRGFRDLPLNTIFTALGQEERDQKTGKKLTKPSLNGKISTEAAGFLDVVLYMYLKVDPEDDKVKRCLLSMGTEDVVAKDRTDSIPPVVQNPTMQILVDHMSGQTDN